MEKADERMQCEWIFNFGTRLATLKTVKKQEKRKKKANITNKETENDIEYTLKKYLYAL